MEQKFSNNSIDLQMLREFCEGEGELVEYRKGDQMERSFDTSKLGYISEKYLQNKDFCTKMPQLRKFVVTLYRFQE